VPAVFSHGLGMPGRPGSRDASSPLVLSSSVSFLPGRRLQIGIVSDYFYPQLGGITEHAYGQARELARRGHEVTLITPNLVRPPKIADALAREAPFEILRVGRAYPFYINASETLLTVGPRLASDVSELFAQRRFDVLHVHNPFGVSLPIIAIERSTARVTLGTFHSVVPEGYRLLRVFKPLLRRVLSRLDARIAVSSAVVASIGAHFAGFAFDVIPNGVDSEFFTPAATALPWLDGRKRNVLFVGRFDPRNGLKEMLQAFVLLRKRRHDVRLIVLGDGPLRPVYKRVVPRYLRDDVLFEGRVDGLRPRYLASAEVLCTPCRLASFGMVLVEAMSAGVPVVASNISGFRLLVQDGAQGLLVGHDRDGEGFCDALDYMLEYPERAREMGHAGRERVIENFSWPIVADQLEELYGRLLSQSSGHRPRVFSR
jgi:phosphatidyl-myo-inositol alpha-mannosyltransferase